MAEENSTREYHLTPNGWVSGTYTNFNTVYGDEVGRPTDAIETWIERCYQRSGWSPEEYTQKIVWHDPTCSETERDSVRRRLPSPFTKTRG